MATIIEAKIAWDRGDIVTDPDGEVVRNSYAFENVDWITNPGWKIEPMIPAPGDGYRLLEKGERIQKGDECFLDGNWSPAVNQHLAVGDLGTVRSYRRKVEEKPDPGEGYRLLDDGESIFECDQVLKNGAWWPTNMAGYVTGQRGPLCVYRRKVEVDKEPKYVRWPVFMNANGDLLAKEPSTGNCWAIDKLSRRSCAGFEYPDSRISSLAMLHVDEHGNHITPSVEDMEEGLVTVLRPVAVWMSETEQ